MDLPGQTEHVRLTYDAVIATRHRIEALKLSIPLLLAQSRPPARLIVIDSSDDHAPVAKTVRDVCTGWDGELIVEHQHATIGDVVPLLHCPPSNASV